MAGILGALKGASRGLVLLVLVALVPAIAWGAAVLGESTLGLGFWSVFLGALVLQAFLGVCALFGIASEVQESHSAALDRAGQGTEREAP